MEYWQPSQAQRSAGQVVQDGEGQYHRGLELGRGCSQPSNGLSPFRFSQVGLDERGSQGSQRHPLRFLEQLEAEVQPNVGTAMPAAVQLARQLPVATAQIQDVRLAGQTLEHLAHARLQAHARGGKLERKGLVKLTVEPQ